MTLNGNHRVPLSSSPLYQLLPDSHFGNTVTEFKFRGACLTVGRGWLAIAGGASWSRSRLLAVAAGRVLCSFVILCARVLLDRPSFPSLSKCSQKQANILALFRTTFPETFPRINSGVEWKAESESSVCGAVGCLPPLWKVVHIYVPFSAPFLLLHRMSLIHPVP